MFRINFLQVELHDYIRSFLISVNLPINYVIPPSCKLYSVDVADDWIYLIELYVQLYVIIHELGLNIYRLYSTHLFLCLFQQTRWDMLLVTALHEYHHQ
jgi:hypothetical protein